MLKSATLLGSSSGRNAGDAALMAAIMDAIDDACRSRLTYEIPTIKPSFVRNNYNNIVKPVSIMPWNLSLKIFGLPTYQSIMRSDLSLVFDAVLFDRSLYNPLFNFLSTLQLFMPKAKKRGKKLCFFNVGTGPVRTLAGKEMLKRLAEAMDFITVRDQDSYDILKDIGVQNPNMLVTADAALNLKPCSDENSDQILQTLGLRKEDDILAININTYLDTWADNKHNSLDKNRFLSDFAEALNSVCAQTGASVLFVSTQHQDLRITQDLMQRLTKAPKKAVLSNTIYNHYEIKGVLSKVSLLCAMRLHAMILASSAFTPIIGLPYLPKVNHYFKTLGLQNFLLEFKNFSAPNLKEHLFNGWQMRHKIRERLLSTVPEYKERALIASKLVGTIHLGENLDAAVQNFKRILSDQTLQVPSGLSSTTATDANGSVLNLNTIN